MDQYQRDNQGLLTGRDNHGYSSLFSPPQPPPPSGASNLPSTYHINPVTVQPGYQASNQGLHNIQVVQPAPVVVHYQFPSTYWGLALFSMICCFWPFGVIAMIYSYRSGDAIKYGHLGNAEYYSRKSKIFSFCSIAIGLFCNIVIAIAFGVAG